MLVASCLAVTAASAAHNWLQDDLVILLQFCYIGADAFYHSTDLVSGDTLWLRPAPVELVKIAPADPTRSHS